MTKEEIEHSVSHAMRLLFEIETRVLFDTKHIHGLHSAVTTDAIVQQRVENAVRIYCATVSVLAITS